MVKDFIMNPTGNVEMIQGRWRYEVEWNDGSIEFVDQDSKAFDRWFNRCVDHQWEEDEK